ncbi:Imm3 family immunity protein [Priestia megaterium]|jgi:hypothetical protein|uniref:Imm3 family immunity protein n=1 Tax=Priestia megaterium TaxID=1404 RepID=UPI0004AD7CBF|nr:Imm3 family immunity protein [Priestia megaterium]MCM3020500.1 Imm3 family immunity protein [Priestia megaterium]PFB06759.1 hypothetical protein CN383_01950 [Priestia megaterium]
MGRANCFTDEFDNLGEVEDFIVDTAIGEIAITHEQVFVGRIRGITGRLGKFDLKEAQDELTLDEIKDLLPRMNKEIEGLKHVKADHNPSVE